MVLLKYSIYDDEEDDGDLTLDGEDERLVNENVVGSNPTSDSTTSSAQQHIESSEPSGRDDFNNCSERLEQTDISDTPSDTIAGSTEALSNRSDDNFVVTASGVASATAGLLVCGPLVAILLGFGAAYAAESTPQGNGVGDTARSLGRAALVVAAKVREYAIECGLPERVTTVVEESRTFVERKAGRSVVQQAEKVVKESWTCTKDFVKEYDVLERGKQTIGKGVCWLAEKIVRGVSNLKETRQTLSTLDHSNSPNPVQETNPVPPPKYQAVWE